MNFMQRSNAIGVFDSGVGGLTVVKKVCSFLPSENIIYFGDTARVPYGTKSNKTVVEYSLEDAGFLLSKNVKIIIVACNTVSSVALDVLREKLKIPVIGMIEPGTKLALEKSKNGKIGVIGTNATINNLAYSKALKLQEPSVHVIEKSCPLFVPLAEEGWVEHQATKLIVEEYLNELKRMDIDTLILGCTHYPILANIIQEVMGEKVELIDSGTAASITIEDYLQSRHLKNPSNVLGEQEYYVSDYPSKFKKIAELFLGKEIDKVNLIDYESLREFSKFIG